MSTSPSTSASSLDSATASQRAANGAATLAASPAATATEGPLPGLQTPMNQDEILTKLGTLSKRGKLPGYHAKPIKHPGSLFETSAFATPFDAIMLARVESSAIGETTASGTTLHFATKMLPTWPIGFAIALLLTIWPGVYFMDLMVADWLPSLWHPWVTYYWYLPLTILSIPFAWRGAIKKSRASAQQSALENIEQLRAELSGTIVPAH